MRGYGFTAVGGPEHQAFLDVPVPVPGADELLVRVRAAGVNPGDWRLREGSYGVPAPAVLGREVAGTVEEAGPGVTGFAPGVEVFGGCPGMVGGGRRSRWSQRRSRRSGRTACHPRTPPRCRSRPAPPTTP